MLQKQKPIVIVIGWMLQHTDIFSVLTISSCTQSFQLFINWPNIAAWLWHKTECLHVDVKVVIVLGLWPSIFEFCPRLLILSLDVWDKSYSGFCVLISYYLFIFFIYIYFLVSFLIMLVPFGPVCLSFISLTCPWCLPQNFYCHFNYLTVACLATM